MTNRVAGAAYFNSVLGTIGVVVNNFVPEFITGLVGVLANGATYTITGGTNVQFDGQGNIRWESGSTFNIALTDGAAELIAEPLSDTAVTGNPFVWSDTQGGSQPTQFTSDGPDAFVYTPGAVDAMLTTQSGPQRIVGGVSNGAIRGADDWGLVRGSTGTSFDIQGRDAEAMRFSLLPV